MQLGGRGAMPARDVRLGSDGSSLQQSRVQQRRCSSLSIATEDRASSFGSDHSSQHSEEHCVGVSVSPPESGDERRSSLLLCGDEVHARRASLRRSMTWGGPKAQQLQGPQPKKKKPVQRSTSGLSKKRDSMVDKEREELEEHNAGLEQRCREAEEDGDLLREKCTELERERDILLAASRRRASKILKGDVYSPGDHFREAVRTVVLNQRRQRLQLLQELREELETQSLELEASREQAKAFQQQVRQLEVQARFMRAEKKSLREERELAVCNVLQLQEEMQELHEVMSAQMRQPERLQQARRTTHRASTLGSLDSLASQLETADSQRGRLEDSQELALSLKPIADGDSSEAERSELENISKAKDEGRIAQAESGPPQGTPRGDLGGSGGNSEERELSELRTHCQQLEAEIAALRTKLADRAALGTEGPPGDVGGSTNGEEQCVSELRSRCAQKEEEVSGLQAELKALRSEHIACLQEREASELRARCQQLEAEVKATQTVQAELQALRAEHAACLQDRGALSELRARCNELEAEVKALQAQRAEPRPEPTAPTDPAEPGRALAERLAASEKVAAERAERIEVLQAELDQVQQELAELHAQRRSSVGSGGKKRGSRGSRGSKQKEDLKAATEGVAGARCIRFAQTAPTSAKKRVQIRKDKMKEWAEEAQCKVYVGATVRVLRTISYRFTTGDQKPYKLAQGSRGEVVRMDADGDAEIEWEESGTKWLLKKDFYKVTVLIEAEAKQQDDGAASAPEAQRKMATAARGIGQAKPVRHRRRISNSSAYTLTAASASGWTDNEDLKAEESDARHWLSDKEGGATNGGASGSRSGRPGTYFEVGCEYDTTSPVILRSGEDLTSDLVTELELATRVRALEFGSTDGMKRMRIACCGSADEGWLSWRTKAGHMLVSRVEPVLCPSGHSLTTVSNMDATNCGSCKSAIDCGAQVMHCEECSWYLCEVCHPLSTDWDLNGVPAHDAHDMPDIPPEAAAAGYSSRARQRYAQRKERQRSHTPVAVPEAPEAAPDAKSPPKRTGSNGSGKDAFKRTGSNGSWKDAFKRTGSNGSEKDGFKRSGSGSSWRSMSFKRTLSTGSSSSRLSPVSAARAAVSSLFGGSGGGSQAQEQ